MKLYSFNILLFLLVLIGGWICVMLWIASLIVRGVFRVVGRIAGFVVGAPPPPGPTVMCRRARCTAENPVGANYCRRCGCVISAAIVGAGTVPPVTI